MFSFGICIICCVFLAENAYAACPDPGFVPNADRTPITVQPGFSASEQVSFQCQSPGYELLSGNLYTVCMPDDTWAYPLPNCSIISCGDPGQIPFGNRTLTGTTYSSTVTYFCMNTVLYEFAPPITPPTTPSVTLTCNQNKQWSPSLPACQRKSCGNPPTVTGTSLMMSGMQAGDVAVYTALSGYTISGSATLTCVAATKSWQPAGNPTTTISTCIFPPVAANTAWDTNTTAMAQLNSNVFLFNQTIVASCVLGYSPLAGNSIRTCQDGGTWSGSPLTCQTSSCQKLSISGAVVSQTSTEVGANATSICRPGYYHSGAGDAVRECLPTGSWSGTDIICSAVPCPAINFTIPVNASVSVIGALDSSNTTKSSIGLVYDALAGSATVVNAGYGDQVLFSCYNGTRWARGLSSFKCLSDGTWSGTDPIVCKLVIPPPGIGVDQPNVNAVEAANADYVGRTIVIVLFSGLLIVCVADSFSMLRKLHNRIKQLNAKPEYELTTMDSKQQPYR